MSDAVLSQLADAAGISVDWTDARGKPQRVEPDTLRAILRALDLRCDGDAQCAQSIAQVADEDAMTSLPPLLTAQVGSAIDIPAQAGLHGKRYQILFEDGGEFEGRFDSDPSLPTGIVPLMREGYHRLEVGDQQATLAVAPRRCFSIDDIDGVDGPLWALGAQLYSLRRDGDAGIGDFGALTTLAQSAARHGAAGLAISPVHAMFSADRDRYSPYGPSSRLFLNASHIDPQSVLGADALADAIRGIGPETEQKRRQLEANELIDWPASAAWRLAVLRALFERFNAQASEIQRAAFDAFRAEGGEALEDHARFEAMHASWRARMQNGDWRAWPQEYHDPRGAAIAEFARRHADEVAFHAFLQWQAARGLQQAQRSARDAGMPIGLIADLAVGADGGGSQAWSRQRQMISGLSVGAPPDLLNVHGQCWGLGALSPRALRKHGFHAYIEMLRAAFRHAGGVRIDHILGLARLWLVPDGASATHGAYLRYPLDDLLRLIMLESRRHRAIVIGEDLGTVPSGFDRKLADSGILGIRVLWFQRDGIRFLPPAAWSGDAIATTSTHDLPTVAGWWEGRDIAWRARLDLLEQGSSADREYSTRAAERDALQQALHEAGCAGEGNADDAAPIADVLSFIGATPAPLAILPVEDALGLPEQPNLPGTVDTHPNWRRRLSQTVDRMLDAPTVAARLRALAHARQEMESNE